MLFGTSWRTFKLHEKPSALQWEHTGLVNINCINFSCFGSHFDLPWSGFRNWIKIRWPHFGWVLVVRASDCQSQSLNSLGFYASILRYSGIWDAADETVWNKVQFWKIIKRSPLLQYILNIWTNRYRTPKHVHLFLLRLISFSKLTLDSWRRETWMGVWRQYSPVWTLIHLKRCFWTLSTSAWDRSALSS